MGNFNQKGAETINQPKNLQTKTLSALLRVFLAFALALSMMPQLPQLAEAKSENGQEVATKTENVESENSSNSQENDSSSVANEEAQEAATDADETSGKAEEADEASEDGVAKEGEGTSQNQVAVTEEGKKIRLYAANSTADKIIYWSPTQSDIEEDGEVVAVAGNDSNTGESADSPFLTWDKVWETAKTCITTVDVYVTYDIKQTGTKVTVGSTEKDIVPDDWTLDGQADGMVSRTLTLKAYGAASTIISIDKSKSVTLKDVILDTSEGSAQSSITLDAGDNYQNGGNLSLGDGVILKNRIIINADENGRSLMAGGTVGTREFSNPIKLIGSPSDVFKAELMFNGIYTGTVYQGGVKIATSSVDDETDISKYFTLAANTKNNLFTLKNADNDPKSLILYKDVTYTAVYWDPQTGNDAYDGGSEGFGVKTFERVIEIFNTSTFDVNMDRYQVFMCNTLLVDSSVTLTFDGITDATKKSKAELRVCENANADDSSHAEVKCMIKVQDGAILTLSNILLRFDQRFEDRRNADSTIVTVEAGGTLNIANGAVLTGKPANGTTVGNGAGVAVFGDATKTTTLNMTGGEVSYRSKGVYVEGKTDETKTKFNLSGGKISNNSNLRQNMTYLKVSSGGGVYTKLATFKITGGEVSSNDANEKIDFDTEKTYSYGYGMGIAVGSGTAFEMSDGKISNNILSGNYDTAIGYGACGGGIYVASDMKSFVMTGGTISGNEVAKGYSSGGGMGGGIYYSVNQALSFTPIFKISGGDVTNNKAWYRGAGVYVNVGSSLSGTTNFAVDISSDTKKLNITQNELSRVNDSSEGGAGIFAYIYESKNAPKLRLNNVNISNNIAKSHSVLGCGATIYAYYLSNPSQFDVDGCTFSSNVMQGSPPSSSYTMSGGGLYMYIYGATSSPVTQTTSKLEFKLKNCTFDGNVAGRLGGGAFLYEYYCNLRFQGCTFSGNTAKEKGGALYLSGGYETNKESYIFDKTNTFKNNVCNDKDGGQELAVFANTFLTGGNFTLKDATKSSIYFQNNSATSGLYVSPNNITSNANISQFVADSCSMPFILDSNVTKKYVINTPSNLTAGTSIARPCGNLTWEIKDENSLTYSCENISAYASMFSGGNIPANMSVVGDGTDVILKSTATGGDGVFVNGQTGDDTHAGLTPGTAVKSIDKAKEILKSEIAKAVAAKTYFNPTINICDTVDISSDTTISLNPADFAQSTKAYETLPVDGTNPSVNLFYPTIRKHSMMNANAKPMFNITSAAKLNFENVYMQGDSVNVAGNGIEAKVAGSTINVGQGTRIFNFRNSAIYTKDNGVDINVTGDAIIGFATYCINSQTAGTVTLTDNSQIWAYLPEGYTGAKEGVYATGGGFVKMTKNAVVKTENIGGNGVGIEVYNANFSMGEDTDTEDSHPTIYLTNGGTGIGYTYSSTTFEIKGYSEIVGGSSSTFGIKLSGSNSAQLSLDIKGHAKILKCTYAIYVNERNSVKNKTINFSEYACISKDSYTGNTYGIYFGGSGVYARALNFNFSDNAFIDVKYHSVYISGYNPSYSSDGSGGFKFNFSGNSYAKTSDSSLYYTYQPFGNTITLNDNAYLESNYGGSSSNVDPTEYATVYINAGSSYLQTYPSKFSPESVVLNGNSKIVNKNKYGCAFSTKLYNANNKFANTLTLNGSSSVEGAADATMPVITFEQDNQGQSKVIAKAGTSIKGGKWGVLAINQVDIDMGATVENGIYLKNDGFINLTDTGAKGATANKFKLGYDETKNNSVVVKPGGSGVTSAVDFKSVFNVTENPEGVLPQAGEGSQSTWLVVKGEEAVFLSGNGDDANSGLSAGKPVKTFAKAKQVLKTMKSGTDIVIVGAGVNPRLNNEWTWEFDDGGKFTNSNGETWNPVVRNASTYNGEFVTTDNQSIFEGKTFTLKNIKFKNDRSSRDNATVDKTMFNFGTSSYALSVTFENVDFSDNEFLNNGDNGNQVIYCAIRGTVSFIGTKCNNSTFIFKNTYSNSSNYTFNSLFANINNTYSSLVLNNMEFNNNTFNTSFNSGQKGLLSMYGFAFYVTSKNVQIQSSSISSNIYNGVNTVSNAYGYFYSSNQDALANIDHFTFDNNQYKNLRSNANDSYMFMMAGASGKIANSSFSNNSSDGAMGKVVNWNAATSGSNVEISSVTATGNSVKNSVLRFASSIDIKTLKINSNSNALYGLYYAASQPMRLNGGKVAIDEDIYLSNKNGNIVLTNSIYQKGRLYKIKTSSSYGQGDAVVVPDNEKVYSAAQYANYFQVTPYYNNYESSTLGSNITLKRRIFVGGSATSDSYDGSAPNKAVKTISRMLALAKNTNANLQSTVFYICGQVDTGGVNGIDLTSAYVDGEMSSEIKRYTGFDVGSVKADAYSGVMFNVKQEFTLTDVIIDGAGASGDCGTIINNDTNSVVNLKGATVLKNNSQGTNSKASMIVNSAGTLSIAGTSQVLGNVDDVAIYHGGVAMSLDGNIYIVGSIELSGDENNKDACKFVNVAATYSPYNNSVVSLKTNGVFESRKVLEFPVGHAVDKDDLAHFALDSGSASAFTLDKNATNTNIAELQERTVIYLKHNREMELTGNNYDGRNDTNDGLTPDTAKYTLAGAWDAMKAQEEKRGKGGGIIYLLAPVQTTAMLNIQNIPATSKTTEMSYITYKLDDTRTYTKSTSGFVSFRRYSQPTAHSQMHGYSAETYKGAMFQALASLELSNVEIDGHGSDIVASQKITAPAIISNDSLITLNTSLSNQKFEFNSVTFKSNKTIYPVAGLYPVATANHGEGMTADVTVNSCKFEDMEFVDDATYDSPFNCIIGDRLQRKREGCSLILDSTTIERAVGEKTVSIAWEADLELGNNNSIVDPIAFYSKGTKIKPTSTSVRNMIDGEVAPFKLKKMEDVANGQEVVEYPSDAPTSKIYEYFELDEDTSQIYNLVKSTSDAKQLILDYKPPVFIDGISGNDSNDGLSADKSVKTLKRAYQVASSCDAGYIVVVATVTLDKEGTTYTLSKNSYADSDAQANTVNLHRQVELVRYVKPSATDLSGFTKTSNKSYLIDVQNGTLVLDDVEVSGHATARSGEIASSMVAVGETGGSLVHVAKTTGNLEVDGGVKLYDNNRPVDSAASDSRIINNDGNVILKDATLVSDAATTRAIFNNDGSKIEIVDPSKVNITGVLSLNSTSYVTIDKEIPDGVVYSIDEAGQKRVRDRQLAKLAWSGADASEELNHFNYQATKTEFSLPIGLSLKEKYGDPSNISLEDYSDITIKKTWKKTNGYSGNQPDNLQFKLSNAVSSGENADFVANVSVPASGEATVNHGVVTKSTVSGEDVWTITLKDMPTYESKGAGANKIKYHLEETQVGGSAPATVKWNPTISEDTQSGTFAVANTKQYTLTYNKNGNDVSGNVATAQTVDYGTKLVADAGTSLSKQGYSLIGWNTAADGSGTHYYVGDEVSITSDIELFAMWAKMTVSIVSSDVSGSKLARGQKAKFNIVIESPETSEKIGKSELEITLPEKITLYDSFNTIKPSGWLSNTKVLNWDNAGITKGSKTFEFVVVADEDISLNDIDHIPFKTTLTLNEKANVVQTLNVAVVDAFKITYNANGASGTAPVDSKFYWQESDKTKNATVLGDTDLQKVVGGIAYSFVGWNSKADGSGMHYNAGQAVDMATYAKDLELFAQFGTSQFDVALEKNLSKVRRGETITYSIKVNIPEASDTTTPLLIEMPVPENTTFVSADKGGVLSNGKVAWTVNNATVGDNVFTVKFKVSEGIDVNNVSSITANASVTHKTSNKMTASSTTPITKSFKITYNLNGATSGDVPVDNNYYSPEFKDQPTCAAKGNITKTNAAFCGWNTVADGSGKHYYPGSPIAKVDISADQAQDITLYAQFFASEFTGTGELGKDKVRRGEVITYTDTVEFAENSMTSPVVVNLQIPSSTTLVEGSITSTYGQTAVSQNTLSWTLSTSGIKGKHVLTYKVKVNEDASVNNVTSIDNLSSFAYYDSSVVAKDTVKKQVAKSYKVTYNTNGATSGSAPTDDKFYAPEYNEQITVAEKGDIVKTDCVFTGWNTVANGSGTRYAEGATFAPNEDVTLYAQFAKANISAKTQRNLDKVRRGERIDYTLTVDISDASSTIDITCPLNLSDVEYIDGSASAGGTYESYEEEGKVVWKNVAVTSGVNTFKWSVKLSEDAHINYVDAIVQDVDVSYAGATFDLQVNTPITESFTIEYDANEGIGDVPVDNEFYSLEYGDRASIHGNFEATPLTKEGYRFADWNDSQDGSGQAFRSGQRVSLGDDTTLYAKWDANLYTVRYDANGATGNMNAQTFVYDKAQKLASNAFTKAGFKFTNWSTEKDGSGQKYLNEQEIKNLTSTMNDVIVLYAQFSDNTKTVTFDTSGGSAVASQDVEVGKTAIKPADPTRDGYTFAGWFADGADEAFDFATEISDNLKLIAKWTANTYTVHFIGNGETSGEMQDQAFEFDVAQNLSSNTFARNGYTFANWYYYDENGDLQTVADAANVKNLTSESGGVVDLYADWKGGNYTIVYDANGGAGQMDEVKTAFGESVEIATNKFTREGYKFVGWSTEPGDDKQVAYNEGDSVADLASAVDEKVTLYAQWVAIDQFVTVTFDSDGGSPVDPIQVKRGEFASQPDYPSKAGFEFDGWFADGADEAFDFYSTAIDDNITLKAKWTSPTYIIHFYANGALGGNMSSIDFKGGNSTQLTANKFIFPGYTFVGWNTNEQGTGKEVEDKATVDETTFTYVDNTITLYAQWKANSYQITFNANEGTGEMESLSATFGSDVKLPQNTFAREGFVFKGWNTKADGSGTSYDDLATVRDLSLAQDGEVELFAQWVALGDVVYLTFFDDDGQTRLGQQAVKSGEMAKRPEDPVKAGYTFAGWYEKTGEGVTSDTTFDFNNPITAGKSLIAKWIANAYTVSFDGNGATSGSMENVNATYGNKFKLPSVVFKKTGAIFGGWNTQKDGKGKTYADGAEVMNLTQELNGEVVLYAIWKNDYKVSINVKGSGTIKVNGKTDKSQNVTADSKVALTWSSATSGTNVNLAKKITIKMGGKTIYTYDITKDKKASWKESNPYWKKTMKENKKYVSWDSIVKAAKNGGVYNIAKATGDIVIDAEFELMTPVYRMYNRITSEHLFTADKSEYDNFAKLTYANKEYWVAEGIDWLAPTATTGNKAVYRLYNPGLGALRRSSHYYTTDAKEAANLVKKWGWKYDFGGKAAYLSGGSQAVYTCYNEKLGSAHHYTSSFSEYQSLKKHDWDLEEWKNKKNGKWTGFMSCITSTGGTS